MVVIKGFMVFSETSINGRHQVLKFSSVEYYVKVRFKKTNARPRQLKRDQYIDVLESGIISPKSVRIDAINLYITNVLGRLDGLLNFYGFEFQQRKFLNYIGRQKVHKELINIFWNGGKKNNTHANHQVCEIVDNKCTRKRRRKV
jgi:hypothetical protein